MIIFGVFWMVYLGENCFWSSYFDVYGIDVFGGSLLKYYGIVILFEYLGCVVGVSGYLGEEIFIIVFLFL